MTKIITVKGLALQFDWTGDEPDAAELAVEQINLVLQREPYDLCAQILGAGADQDLEVQETYRCDVCCELIEGEKPMFNDTGTTAVHAACVED